LGNQHALSIISFSRYHPGNVVQTKFIFNQFPTGFSRRRIPRTKDLGNEKSALLPAAMSAPLIGFMAP
jgi:hypothetical protein